MDILMIILYRNLMYYVYYLQRMDERELVHTGRGYRGPQDRQLLGSALHGREELPYQGGRRVQVRNSQVNSELRDGGGITKVWNLDTWVQGQVPGKTVLPGESDKQGGAHIPESSHLEQQ